MLWIESLLERVTTVQGEKREGNEIRENLNHESMPGAREQVIDIDMTFQLAGKTSIFQDFGDLFGGKAEPVGCDPIG